MLKGHYMYIEIAFTASVLAIMVIKIQNSHLKQV